MTLNRIILKKNTRGSDYLETLISNHLGNEIVVPCDQILETMKIIDNQNTFKHGTATVHIKFTKDGKSLNDHLINYFRALKNK